MKVQLSIITPTYNDLDNFSATLTSLRTELYERDELLIIDSSSDRWKTQACAEGLGLRCSVRYYWVPPSGVYAAQNRGIVEAIGEWIQIVNAGDRLLPGSRQEISKMIKAYGDINVHVFCQRGVGRDAPSYIFTPTKTSVWPHQSVVVRKSVYENEGLYPEKYRFGADQVFFGQIRKTERWKIHDVVLTDYLLGGLSSGVGYVHLLEIYAVRRALGQGFVRSLICTIVMPITHKLLGSVFGVAAIANLKARLFPYYKTIRPYNKK